MRLHYVLAALALAAMQLPAALGTACVPNQQIWGSSGAGCSCGTETCEQNQVCLVENKDVLAGQDGESLCEGHSYDEAACNNVGCCHYSDPQYGGDGNCWSGVGRGACKSDTGTCTGNTRAQCDTWEATAAVTTLYDKIYANECYKGTASTCTKSNGVAFENGDAKMTAAACAADDSTNIFKSRQDYCEETDADGSDDGKTCRDYVDDLIALARDEGKMDCGGIRYYRLTSGVGCIKDSAGAYCPSEDDIQVSNSFPDFGAQQTQSSLEAICGECGQAQMIAYFAGVADPDAVKSLMGMFSMYCVKQDSHYCYPAFADTVMGENPGTCHGATGDTPDSCFVAGGKYTEPMMTQSFLAENVCGSNTCVIDVMKAFADFMVSIGQPAEAKQMNGMADFFCLKENDNYCMAKMYEFPYGPSEGGGCGTCDSGGPAGAVSEIECGTCAGGKQLTEPACNVAHGADHWDDYHGSPPWTAGTWTVKTDTSGATCKAHLQTYESLGCCMKSINEMMVSGGEPSMVPMFTSAGIDLPIKCSLDALEADVVVTLNGMTLEECQARQGTLLTDMRMSAGQAQIKAGTGTCAAVTARRLGKSPTPVHEDAASVRRLDRSLTAAASTLSFKVTAADGTQIASANGGMEKPSVLKTTATSAISGDIVSIQASGVMSAPKSNPDATGTVVSNPKADKALADTNNAQSSAASATALIATTLAAAIAAAALA